jgi:hypothetical protein
MKSLKSGHARVDVKLKEALMGPTKKDDVLGPMLFVFFVLVVVNVWGYFSLP